MCHSVIAKPESTLIRFLTKKGIRSKDACCGSTGEKHKSKN